MPTSTSFFLSALQPLGYGYRGRADQTVGFGPVNSLSPADFWITQEFPGVPAGAAHIAFPAPSRDAVQAFFYTALKAGATIHGEPCVRDAHGYYSAAVIDFDGNSIEAVYRPGFGEENKENYAGTAVSKRSSSRAPSTVSRAASCKALSIAPTSASGARSAAPSAPVDPEPPKPQGDALEALLNQARSTADVARRLVEQVRPHLPNSSSTPALPAPKEHIHNPDAFAKPGDGGNAVIGTILGVAAGAALTYAITSTRKDSPDSSEDKNDQRGRRPSIAGRSATAPSQQIPHCRALEAPSSHQISMHDNDYSSTIKPTPRHVSTDSGLGVSQSSMTSRASRKGGSQKMLEAPPTSYKAPTVLTQAQSAVTGHSRSRSKTRGDGSSCSSSRSSSKHHHSRSASRSRGASGSNTGASGYETVLHVTTQRSYGAPAAAAAAAAASSERRSRASSARPAPQKAESKSSAASSSGGGGGGSKRRSSSRSSAASMAASKASTARPERYPLPPSRAATWAGVSGDGGSFVSALETRRRGGGTGGGGDGDGTGDTRTVIGKMRDLQGLGVRGGEVRPEDSVSQVSSVRSGRR